MCKYEYKIENNKEYEISYYYFKNNNEIFLCKEYQDVEDGSDIDLDIATTQEEYGLEELILDEDSIISKEEFDILYDKYKDLFEIDMFKDK